MGGAKYFFSLCDVAAGRGGSLVFLFTKSPWQLLSPPFWFLIMHCYYYAFVMFYLLLENIFIQHFESGLSDRAGSSGDLRADWPGGPTGGSLHSVGVRSRYGLGEGRGVCQSMWWSSSQCASGEGLERQTSHLYRQHHSLGLTLCAQLLGKGLPGSCSWPGYSSAALKRDGASTEARPNLVKLFCPLVRSQGRLNIWLQLGMAHE